MNRRTPLQKTYYSMVKPFHLKVKHYIEDLLNKWWITKSTSHYSSPIFVIWNKDGSLWLCCNYCSLNSKTQVDRHPLLRIQDVIDSLKGNKYFSVLDQQQAHHQIYPDAKNHPLTPFITPWDLNEWVSAPFGLTNATAEFQRFMENAWGEFVFPYVGDSLAFFHTFVDHLNHLKKLFQILREKGIKVTANKCKLFQRQVNYLGRVISSGGYYIDQANIKAVTILLNQKPRTTEEVGHQLGLIAY